MSACIFAVPAVAQLSNPFSSTPSFGLLVKKTALLHSKLPPIYNATGQTVSIKSSDPLLTIQIEKQLTGSDSTIRVSDMNPDLLIECAVSQNTPMHAVTVRTNTATEEHQQGQLTAIFRITQLRRKLVVKSDVASAEIDEVTKVSSNASGAKKVFGLSLPATPAASTNKTTQYATTADAQNALVEQVARKIASYVVTTDMAVVVPIATGGSLNGPNRLVDSQLWPRYLEALEVLTPATDARVDAYRVYDIGVANEALGYAAQDNKSAVKYLQEANNDYGQAAEAKGEEKNFILAQSRIKASLQYYSDIGKLQPMGAAGQPLTTNLGAKSPAAEGALTNKDVTDMVAGHLDQANIVDTIVNATDVNFDLSPHGQIDLAKAGVNGQVLTAMKQRSRGTVPAQSTVQTQPVRRR